MNTSIIALRDETARCMTCGMVGSVSLQPDGGRHSFYCRNCGYVVPCQDYNARADTVRAYCTPGWDDDNIGKPVPAAGGYAPREFAWGCLTCLGTVTAIVWEGFKPSGGLLIHDHGQCERCGHVVRVSEAYEYAARFRAFAPDGSRGQPMPEHPTKPIPAPNILCRSCGIPGTVSCFPSERFNTFACVTCGEVVPCHGGFARPADCNRFADQQSALREVGGCLSCGSDVLHPQGNVVVAGDCVNCGRVERVPGAALRFRRAPGWPSLQLLGKAAAP